LHLLLVIAQLLTHILVLSIFLSYMLCTIIWGGLQVDSSQAKGCSKEDAEAQTV
jgi:hypothetical protein